MADLLNLPDLKVSTSPDPSVEPGHQWIIISNTQQGRGLASVLSPSSRLPETGDLRLAHDHAVDEMLIRLVDLAADLRLTAPHLMQLTLKL